MTKSERIRYRVHGMDCAQEVSLLRARLSRMAGVRDLRFDVVKASMDVEYAAERVTPEELERAVAGLGMSCERWKEERSERAFDWRQALTWVCGVAVAGGAAAQVQAGSTWVEALLAHEHGHEHGLPMLAVACYAVAVAAGAAPVVKKAWGALRAARADMNLLVALSLVGAAILGEWAEAGTLAFLFSLAGRLESWSMARAREAISKLLEVAPAEAAVVHGDHEHAVAVGRVEVGSLVRVRAGERVPCDGRVERGTSYVNQALLTGESVAVEKGPGDEVYAGSVNESGLVEIRTTRAAEDTRISRLVRMVGQSESRRAPSEQFVERFTRYYTPAVLLLALTVALTGPLVRGGAWSEWFYEGMVILLIACPCALVIGTPVTVTAALTSAARAGVLVKGGAYLEETARLRALVVNVAGVLTKGEPVVEEFEAVGVEEETALGWLAALEEGSGHGVARAVERYARARGVTAKGEEGAETEDGSGVEAWTAEGWRWAGSLKQARMRGAWDMALEERARRLGADGRMVVVCGTGSKVWAVVGLRDALAEDLKASVSRLRGLGLERVEAVTGDSGAVARRAAEEAGLDEGTGDLSPQEKAARVGELLGEWKHVGMVGGRGSDAEALRLARVGISLSRAGGEAAMEAADVVVVRSGLQGVEFLVAHAKRTLDVIRQNIALALVMKALFLAAAMSGVATLWMAVAADMGATFAVTFNGLRLLRARPHQKG